MNLLTALQNAQSRPADEAKRVTEALDAPVADLQNYAGTRAVEQALDAVNREIADEKLPPPPGNSLNEHRADFTDLEPPLQFTDAEAELSLSSEAPEPNPCFLLADEPSPVDDPAGAQVDPAGPHSDDEPVDFSDDQPGDFSDDAAPVPAPVELPSPTDSYASTDSPWGNAPELVSPNGGRTGDDDDGDDGDDDCVPSSRATIPPEDLVPPDPDSGPSTMARLRDRFAEVANGSSAKRWALLGVAASCLVLTVVTVAVLSLSGSRGTPPEPAGAVAPPPVQTDNPEAAPTDEVLVPSTVSASCGNDSDPVGPFAREKSRAWVCSRIHGLDLNVLNITFDKPVVITEISIVPGFDYVAPDGRDEWSRHRLITGVTWRMGGQIFPQVINPTRTGVTKQFPSVRTTQLSMTITSSTRPPMGADQQTTIGEKGDAADVDGSTAVSTVTITGYPVDPGS